MRGAFLLSLAVLSGGGWWSWRLDIRAGFVIRLVSVLTEKTLFSETTGRSVHTDQDRAEQGGAAKYSTVHHQGGFFKNILTAYHYCGRKSNLGKQFSLSEVCFALHCACAGGEKSVR